MDPAAPRVVVGYDGSEASVAALRWAAHEAAASSARLDVVCADDPGSGPAPMNTAAWLTEQGEQRARELAQRGAAQARQEVPGLDATGRSLPGSAVAALVTASQGAWVVVTGTRGRHRLTGALLGSVAFALSAHAHCPVVVVHGDGAAVAHVAAGGGPVVVGVDGSAPSHHAVGLAAQRAALAGVPLRVLCAWSTPPADLAAPDRSGDDRGDPVVIAAKQASARTAEDSAREAQRQHPDLHVETATPQGPPGRALVTESERAGLLVVGSRGHGGFTGLLLGSVGHEVVVGARCPVMVVPRRAHPEHTT